MGILIVDDEDDIRASLKWLLEGSGYQAVISAASGKEALEVLDTLEIDLVLTDITMPAPNGIELCRHIKSDPGLHDIPVVVVTARSDQTMLEKAFDAGAHDFLTKPVDPSALIARVRAALRLKEELDQRRAREEELVDMTHRLERVNAKLRRLSVLDELTGIPNRRYFNLLLRQEWGRAARESLPMSLVMIDIDYFKAFNDHYGHPAGDDCLARVAGTLSSFVRRPGDSVARYGGEEFVVLLANTGITGAVSVADSLRLAIDELNLPHARSPLDRVTISLGVAAAMPEPGSDSMSLVESVDRALYLAKAAGRNQVAIASDMCTPAPVGTGHSTVH